MNAVTLAILIAFGTTSMINAGDDIKMELYSSIYGLDDHQSKILINFLNFLKSSSFKESQNRDYLGCFQDIDDNRMYRGHNKDDASMTNDMCIEHCREQRFAYAATQAK